MECASPKLLEFGSCVSSCSAGSYADGSSCKKCPPGAAACTFTNQIINATSCTTGFFLDASKQMQINNVSIPVQACVQNCPQGFYINGSICS